MPIAEGKGSHNDGYASCESIAEGKYFVALVGAVNRTSPDRRRKWNLFFKVMTYELEMAVIRVQVLFLL